MSKPVRIITDWFYETQVDCTLLVF